jgi:L-fuculose-phosphate aldolase
MSLNESELRRHICKIGRLMRRYGYIDGTAGNISVRLDNECILATPSGLAKGRMHPDQLIVVNERGEKIGAGTRLNQNLYPTSELLMHLECYQQRSDVNAVVHAHPPTAVALTIAGVSLEECIVPEVIIVLGLVPTAPYATPCGEEDRDSIHHLVKRHDAMMLANHGSLTLGADLWTAYHRLEILEHYANILYKVKQLGGATPLPRAEVDKLLALREKVGFSRPEDQVLFQQFYAN